MTLRFMDLSSIDDYVIPLSYQSFFTFHFYSLTIFTVNHYFHYQKRQQRYNSCMASSDSKPKEGYAWLSCSSKVCSSAAVRLSLSFRIILSQDQFLLVTGNLLSLALPVTYQAFFLVTLLFYHMLVPEVFGQYSLGTNP